MSLSEALADHLDRSRGWTLSLIADLSPPDFDMQPRNDLQNIHWLLGHLIFAEDHLILYRCCGSSRLDADFIEPFKRGKTCDPSATPLPPLEKVRSEMDRIHEKALSAIRGMSAEELSAPVLGGPHPMFTDKPGALLHAGRHEAFHAGQIALIRRMLDKPPLR